MPILNSVVAENITRRSDQGTLEPFFVIDTHGDMYVVKGVDGAGRKALVSELICAELGRRCGLPVPPYALMKFPDGMLDFSAVPGVGQLAGGPAFASKFVPHCRELAYEHLEAIPADTKQLLLIFDAWVSNNDRCLTHRGGNVNLLVDSSDDLVVIDHNLAFEGHTDLEHHVFASQRDAFQDLMIRAKFSSILDSALADWDRICDLLPQEWVYRDRWDEDSEVEPTLESRRDWLLRVSDSEFWSQI